MADPLQEEEFALVARLKEIRGEKLNKREQGAYDRFLEKKLAQEVLSFVRRLPKKYYVQLTGKEHQSIKHIINHYGIHSLEGETVDLAAVLIEMHSKILELGKIAKTARSAEEEEIKQSRLRTENEQIETKLKLTKIELQERIGELLPRRIVEEKLQWLSGRLQSLGKRLYRVAGADAQQSLNEFLEELAIECERGGSLTF